MTLDGMPQPVIAYLAAEQAKDARSLAGCFAKNGTLCEISTVLAKKLMVHRGYTSSIWCSGRRCESVTTP